MNRNTVMMNIDTGRAPNPLSLPLHTVIMNGFVKPELLMEFIASMQTDSDIVVLLEFYNATDDDDAVVHQDMQYDELYLHMIAHAAEKGFATREGRMAAQCV